MKKILPQSDILPLILLCLTWVLILIIWGVNALPQGGPGGPETEVARVKGDIHKAGLQPREASHYRILPESEGEK